MNCNGWFFKMACKKLWWNLSIYFQLSSHTDLKWNDFSFNSFESASFPSESLLIFSYTYYSLSIFLHDPPGTKKDCWRESLISYSIFTNLLSMILPLDRFIIINFLYSVLYLFWIIRSISVSSLLMILSLNLQIVT